MNTLLVARRLAAVLLQIVRGLWLARMRMPRQDLAARQAIVRRWSMQMLAGLGVELRVSGRPQRGAVLMVANHVSWLDIPALHASDSHARLVSKAAIGAWPLLGLLARAGGTLFIERERKRDALRVVHEVAAALRAGDVVAVFPEGTTGPGDIPLPFHANLLQAAISAGTPIQPVVLRYSEPGHELSIATQYVGNTTLLQSLIKVCGARGLVAHVHYLEPEPPAEQDRRTLANVLRERIAADLRSVHGLPRGRSQEPTMNDDNSQTAYGVFKPVGHVLASFPTEASARAALAELAQAGFGSDDLAYYDAADVCARATRDIANAGVLAGIGQELNLVKAQRELAEQGHPFISVRAAEDAAARLAGEICGRHDADRAQKYGRLIVEELIEPGSGERQVAESPDRGLDPQTHSGRERNTTPEG